MVSTFQQPAAAVAPQMFASQHVVGSNNNHQLQNHHQQHQQQHFLAPTLPAQPTLSAPQKIQLGEGSAINTTAWGGGGAVSAAPTNGHYLASNATVISNSSGNTIHSINNPPQLFTQQRQPSSSVVVQLSPSQQPPRSDEGGAVTHPVPEFLCHLFSMVTDVSLSHLISWAVPTQNEPDNCGGGFENIGKVVIHDPKTLQDFILGKYYRHSQYSSFQRQLNYFGFKKKIHGGKKGKLCPCSYVHEGLGAEPSTLFSLKRRLRVGGGSSSSSNCSSKTKKSSDSVKKSLQSKAPIHSPKNKKKTAASVTSSSTSSSSTNSPRVTNNGHQNIIVKGPASNEAVIVKDSNHSNFLTTLPLPYTNIQPLPTSYNEGQFSALVGNPAPSVGAIPMTQLPSNNWVQVTVGNGNNMLMPFQPQLQVGISNFHQQLFNTNVTSLSPPNVQGSDAHNVQGTVAPPASSTNIAATANFNSTSTSKDLGNEITIARANEVAREAQKALERAYRKRKQEAADEDVTASKKEGVTSAPAVQQYQQQLQPPPLPPPQVQQMLLPNQFQNLVQQQPGYMAMQNPQQTIPPSTSMEYTSGSVLNAMNNVSAADAPHTPTVDYSAMGKQVLTQFNPQYAHLGGATFPHAPPTTEVPMAVPPPLMNAGATASMGTPSLATNYARISSSRANGSSSPVMFDDMFSKLLSTTLPPPEELFDDSSTGQLSDFNEELHALG